jgi:hypothetical protein
MRESFSQSMPLKIRAKTANTMGPQKVNGRREVEMPDGVAFFSSEGLLPC